MAFLESLGSYVGNFVFLIIVAACGMFVGKKLRDSKDAKTASENNDAKIKE